MTKYITLLLLWLLSINTVLAQIQLERVVIGSTGGFSEAGPVSVSSTVGEPAVRTFSTTEFMLTQGFQQPHVAAELELEVAVSGINASCLNSGDGVAIANVSGGSEPYTYNWSDGNNIADTAIGLDPDLYSVVVTDSDGRTGMGFITIDADVLDNCGLSVFNGITPNGDNYNDTWVIENIEDWPDNSVHIYSRWGDLIWETNSYNNQFNSWNGTANAGFELPEGTYFYMINYSNQIKKGWVQITR